MDQPACTSVSSTRVPRYLLPGLKPIHVILKTAAAFTWVPLRFLYLLHLFQTSVWGEVSRCLGGFAREQICKDYWLISERASLPSSSFSICFALQTTQTRQPQLDAPYWWHQMSCVELQKTEGLNFMFARVKAFFFFFLPFPILQKSVKTVAAASMLEFVLPWSLVQLVAFSLFVTNGICKKKTSLSLSFILKTSKTLDVTLHRKRHTLH